MPVIHLPSIFAEGLKSYPRHASAAKLQMQKMQEVEQLANVQGLPTDRNTLNKLMALHPGINNMSNNHHMVNRGPLSGSAQALALTNYQNMLMRQNSINSNNPNSIQQEASSSFNTANQSPSSSFQGPASFIPGSMQNMPASGFSSPHLPPQQPQQLQQRSLSGNNLMQQSHPQSSQGNNQAVQQQIIQHLLQEMSSNSGGGAQQQSLSGQANGMMARNGSFRSNSPAPSTAAAPTTSNVSGGGGGGIGGGPTTTSRSNSFKGPSNSESTSAANGFNQRSQDLPQNNMHLQDDIVQDIANEFTENGFFNSDLDDTMGYGWKA